MVPRQLQDRLLADVRRHCQAKGYREGGSVNNFVPHDCVAALLGGRGRTGCWDGFPIHPDGLKNPDRHGFWGGGWRPGGGEPSEDCVSLHFPLGGV